MCKSKYNQILCKQFCLKLDALKEMIKKLKDENRKRADQEEGIQKAINGICALVLQDILDEIDVIFKDI